ncbi:tetratricopeptide repeat protein [Aquimarina sp. D1M17]|uniref:tetratricopeptide repeat protein n=1 Tax=Aquimarina acroporae TaxID=2937283 RepID=UPI0020C12BC4|nr:tetratricopeptide repeat protein [Aquimarina acroporae]MCK8522598.1 tetratricopeptide repeat protein [Aquimarina acroporae]
MSKEEKITASKEIMNGPAVHFRQGSSKTMSVIEKAIELDPKNAEAWRELSVAYLKRGMPTKWKPLFDKAVELDPVEWQGWRGYLHLYFYRNYKKAIADFDATDELTPNFDDTPQGQSVNYMRGLAYLGLKNYNKSKLYFETYIKDQANTSGEEYADVTAFLYLGIGYYLEKDYENAKQNLYKALKYSNDHYADAHYYLAKCFYKEQDFSNALIYIKKAQNDFNLGYSHRRNYVEVLYQIYSQDIEALKKELENS